MSKTIELHRLSNNIVVDTVYSFTTENVDAPEYFDDNGMLLDFMALYGESPSRYVN